MTAVKTLPLHLWWACRIRRLPPIGDAGVDGLRHGRIAGIGAGAAVVYDDHPCTGPCGDEILAGTPILIAIPTSLFASGFESGTTDGWDVP